MLLATVSNVVSAGALSYFDIASNGGGGATLALAAIGQTVVILSGGFDLSAGAVISLVNVVLAGDLARSRVLDAWLVMAVGRRHRQCCPARSTASSSPSLRLQPIVVTLSTMFILQGVTLLVMDKPGGFVAARVRRASSSATPSRLAADADSAHRPSLLALWLWLKHTRFGTAHLCRRQRSGRGRAPPACRRRIVAFFVYVIGRRLLRPRGRLHQRPDRLRRPAGRQSACCCRCSPPSWSAARCLGGGRGGPLGTVFGAYILMMVVNILLVLNVSAYYSTIAEGVILILAVLAGSFESDLAPGAAFASSFWSAAQCAPGRPSARPAARRRRGCFACRTSAAGRGHPVAAMPSFLIRHAETLRYALPAYVCLVLVLIATQLALGHALIELGLLELADRAVLLPRHSGAWARAR